MPYFLTDQFRAMLEAAQKQNEDNKNADEGAASGKKRPGGDDKGPVGLYKSLFLRNKVEAQTTKRKADRKAQPRGAAASS